MALSQVSVVLVEPVAVFEFGVAVEVFGLDRTDEGVPAFDFRVCAAEPGRPARDQEHLARSRSPRLTGWTACRQRPGHRRRRRSPRPAEDYPPEVLEALREAYAAGATLLSLCSGSFMLGAAGLLDGRRCTTHWMYADEMQATYPVAESSTPGRCTWTTEPDHQRGHGGRDRRVPAPGPPRARHRGRHQDRPADGGAAAARRRPAAVRRDADPGVHGGQPGPGAHLGAGPPGRAAHRLVAGPAGDDERPDLRPAVRRGDRHHAAQVADPAAHPGGPQPAGGERPRRRADRHPGRLQLRRGDAGALPPRDRPGPGRLPPPVRPAAQPASADDLELSA